MAADDAVVLRGGVGVLTPADDSKTVQHEALSLFVFSYTAR